MFGETANSRTLSRRSLHGQVAHEIGLRIVSGDFPPETILPNEETYSATLKVSRTSYREAMKFLAAKGLVESRPKTGTRVRPRKQWNMLDPDVLSWCFTAGPSMSHARSLFEMRSIVEPAAAAMAAERADDEQMEKIETAFLALKSAKPDTDASVEADLQFHQGIMEACGNDLLTPLGYLIESALAQSFKLSIHRTGARESSIPLHEAVFVAIKGRNPDQSRVAMNVLLSGAWEDIEDVISELSDPEHKNNAAQ